MPRYNVVVASGADGRQYRFEAGAGQLAQIWLWDLLKELAAELEDRGHPPGSVRPMARIEWFEELPAEARRG